MKNNTLLLSSAIAVVAFSAGAAVRPAAIFMSNMVLQRDAPVPVWGTASAGEPVEVRFAGQTRKTAADSEGRWEVKLDRLAVRKEGSDLVVAGAGDTNTLSNVLVGDVWLCSGQSNMEMGFNMGLLGADEFARESTNYPLIRQTKVALRKAEFPQQDVQIRIPWNVCSPSTVRDYTCVGYFFVRRLFRETGVPMGIIDDSWSGCRIDPFTAPEGYDGIPSFEDTAKKLRDFRPGTAEYAKRFGGYLAQMGEWLREAEAAVAAGKAYAPMPARPNIEFETVDCTTQYNAMIAPIARFPVKGAIWYQGCSNAGEYNYDLKMKALIQGWRKVWGYDFPFYYVQLAAFGGENDDPAGGTGFAPIRDLQTKVLSMGLPLVGMACAIDIGMEGDIHPKNKQDVGARLACWALRDCYGKKDEVVSGPLFEKAEVADGKVTISFQYAAGLKTAVKPRDEKVDCATYLPPVAVTNAPAHFAVAGADKVWAWADAKIEGDKIVLSCKKVPEPRFVRYAYRAYPAGVNVYNGADLPMVPFNCALP